ncbi:MAG: nickel-dependent lactate racemase [candidate division WOR-3 bacterium]|nr:MAG: nickel-dependent lactate racemase [candidate division WOR-3 bacterium]
MRIELPYGDTAQLLDVPDRNLIAVLYPNDQSPVQDPEAELDRAASAAADFAADAGRVLVLVNDYTRPTPNSEILERLETVFASRETRFMVCLGTHRKPAEDDNRQIFGPGFFERHQTQVLFHDCMDNDSLVRYGETSFSTEVWFSRELGWPDKIIAINSVEPHYFAGFTGGRKTFLPGVAGADTIRQNHNMVTRDGSAVFSLQGNPVHEDMTEAAAMLDKPVFSIQVVLDRDKRPYSVYSGDLFQTFDSGTSDCRAVHAVRVESKADVIVSALPRPYDVNFYQAQRAVEFARSVLKPSGVHITVSACRKGVGDDDFIQVFSGCQTAADVLGCMEEDRRLGWHKSARLAQILSDADLYAVVGVEDEIVKRIFIQPFPTVQEAFDTALRRIGDHARVYVIPDAGAVVPVLQPGK